MKILTLLSLHFIIKNTMELNSKNKLFRIGPNFSCPAGNENALISNHLRASNQLISSVLLQMLNKATSFKSISDHVSTIWKKLSWHEKRNCFKPIYEQHSQQFGEIIVSWNGFEQMFSNLLIHWAEQEILISSDTFYSWVHEKKEKLNIPSITTIGAVTKNRVDSLQHCLSSYMENVQQFGRKSRFLICDDSDNKSIRQQYRDCAEKLKQEFKLEVDYVGIEEKQLLAQNLIGQGIPKSVIQFALFDDAQLSSTYGANRNAFLLKTVGENILSVDDDTVCKIARSPDQKSGLAVGVPKSIFELWFYENRSKAFNSLDFVPHDVLSLHEKFLAKSPNHALLSENKILDLDTEFMNFSLLNLIKKNEGHVYATFHGLVGDSGSNSPLPVMFSTGAQRERLLSNENMYRTGISSREGCKAIKRASIDFSGPCMTTFFGLDNRDIVPPFFPLFRMEDSLFGETLRICMQNSMYAYLPWVLVHAPLEKRGHNPNTAAMTFDSFWPYDAIMAAMVSFSPGVDKSTPAEKLILLGEHLKRFGSMKFNDYKEIIMEYQRISRAQKIASYEELYNKYPKAPKYWLLDVRNLIDQTIKNLSNPIPLAPDVMIQKLGLEAAEKCLQKLIFQYGELLIFWPLIIEKAKKLKA